MADNLYDYLNRFTLGDVSRAVRNSGIGGYLKDLANPFNKPAKPSATSKRPAGYSTYGTYTVGGIEYDIASGRPTYMPPGSVYPSSSVAPPAAPAAERAYQTEKARVAQLAAQNPELQRYEAARKIAAAKGATPEQVQSAEDIGMQMWAKANPTLAAKVKPGQSGYEAIQGIVGPGVASALNNEQVLGVMSFDPNTVLTTTQNIQGQFRPNQELTNQEILAAMSFDPNVAMKSAANIAYAPMSAAEAAMLQEVGGPKGEYITPMDSFVTPAEKRRQAAQPAASDAFAQLLKGIQQYGG